METIKDYFYSKAVRVASVVALAAVVILGGAAAPAAAQYQHDHDYDHDNRYDDRQLSRSDVQRLAVVNGYADGYEHGIADRRNRRGFNYQHTDEYRNARSGYNTNWRLEREYQNWFRQSYARGYQDGYYGRARNRTYDRSRVPGYYGGNNPAYGNNRYGQYPGYGNYPNYDNREGDKDREEVARIAAQNGYYAGYQRGVYDAQNRNRPNPQGHGAYQFALDGFDPEWGSASTYQQFYRQYFIAGYNDGHSRRNRNFSYRRY